MATSSFFYGESGAPAQDTWDALLEAIEDRVEASATSAATSATNAANSETAAAASAATASTAKTDAETARDAAVTAKTAAESAQASAATSASQASTSETNAAASATAASTSASNAATSETNAGNSATSAASSASSASTSASTATTKASEASTSASNAASSASSASISASDAAASASTAQTLVQSIVGRNKIINGNFGINQRGVSGTVTLAAGAYGHDRWKAGASGCTYTFSTTNNVTTLTITAGSLQQVIEGLNLQSGTHTLSWAGTTQGRIDGGSYGSSGITGTATGGTDLTVEFNTGTVSKVQFEVGSNASLFEQRLRGQELAMCQRYYATTYADTETYAASGFSPKSQTSLPQSMRAAPSLTFTTLASTNLSSLSLSSTTAASVTHIVRMTLNPSAGNTMVRWIGQINADAEL